MINNIVRFLDHKGLDVVVSVVSPYQEIRDELLDLNIRYYFVTTSEIRGREDYFVKDLRVGEKDTILDTTNTTVNEILSLYW